MRDILEKAIRLLAWSFLPGTLLSEVIFAQQSRVRPVQQVTIEDSKGKTVGHTLVVELVEPAAACFEHQDMPVPIAGLRVTFNQRVRRDRHRSGIAFAGIRPQSNWDSMLRPSYHLIRNPNRLALVGACAKVRMQRNAGPDEADDVRGIGVYPRGGNVRIPQAVRGKRNESVQARAGAEAHPVTSAALSKSGFGKQQYHCGYR